MSDEKINEVADEIVEIPAVTEPADADAPAPVVELEALPSVEDPEPAEVLAEPEPTSTEEPIEAPAPSASEDVAPVIAEDTPGPDPVVAAPKAAGPNEARDAQTIADYEQSFPTLTEGDVVKGIVVHIDREGVLVDVGAKSEGIIRPGELSRDVNAIPSNIVSVGEQIDVYVMEAESQDGRLILSKKRADFEKAWERVLEAKVSQKNITAMVTDRVKGGIVVDLGIRGFVPASHVGSGSLKVNLDRYVGQSIPLKVIEVDKDRRKVVLSNKNALDEERQSRKADTLASLQVGQIRRGIVRRLTNYGAFVDVGGIDGLLHISEMSWTRINHPQEVLKEGQEIDVLVLKLDPGSNRISLGLRQILPDPWSEIERYYHVGDVIMGTVTRIVPFGAFVQVQGGIEGIIPNSEMGGRRGGRGGGGDTLRQGAEVEVKVIDLRSEERKLTLSLRQARHEEEQRREKRVVDDYQARSDRDEPRFTIGDHLRAKGDGGF